MIVDWELHDFNVWIGTDLHVIENLERHHTLAHSFVVGSLLDSVMINKTPYNICLSDSVD